MFAVCLSTNATSTSLLFAIREVEVALVDKQTQHTKLYGWPRVQTKVIMEAGNSMLYIFKIHIVFWLLVNYINGFQAVGALPATGWVGSASGGAGVKTIE